MNDLVVSWIRTTVPLAVGAILTWVAGAAGVVIPADASAGLAAGSTFVVGMVYYVALRLVERKWPKLGILLGTPKPPTYGKPAT